MYVPNYIPQPIEIPGNVGDASWTLKLKFIRRVSVLHALSVGLIFLLASLPWPTVSIVAAAGFVLASFTMLEIVRIVSRGTRHEVPYSLALFPLVLVTVSWTANALNSAQIPAWAALAGLAGATLYTALCGRDFSFIGQYFLAMIGSSVGLAILFIHQGVRPQEAAWGLLLNAAYLSFYCYDLASLLSRRRLGEETGAMVDLYRDVLNIFGWLLRCQRHWKRHRIWTVPWS